MKMQIKIQVLTDFSKNVGQLIRNSFRWESVDLEVTEEDTVEKIKQKIGDSGGWEPLIFGSDELKADI